MKKLLFNLTDEQYEELAQLAKQMGVSKSEALRRAIILYEAVKQAQREGSELRRVDRDGTERLVQLIG